MRWLLLALKPRATVCGQRRFWDRLDAWGLGVCWGSVAALIIPIDVVSQSVS